MMHKLLYLLVSHLCSCRLTFDALQSKHAAGGQRYGGGNRSAYLKAARHLTSLDLCASKIL